MAYDEAGVDLVTRELNEGAGEVYMLKGDTVRASGVLEVDRGAKQSGNRIA